MIKPRINRANTPEAFAYSAGGAPVPPPQWDALNDYADELRFNALTSALQVDFVARLAADRAARSVLAPERDTAARPKSAAGGTLGAC